MTTKQDPSAEELRDRPTIATMSDPKKPKTTDDADKNEICLPPATSRPTLMGLPEEVRRILQGHCRPDDYEVHLCGGKPSAKICKHKCRLGTIAFSSSPLFKINHMIYEECSDLVSQKVSVFGLSMSCVLHATHSLTRRQRNFVHRLRVREICYAINTTSDDRWWGMYSTALGKYWRNVRVVHKSQVLLVKHGAEHGPPVWYSQYVQNWEVETSEPTDRVGYGELARRSSQAA